MKFTTKARYGLRIMADLAINDTTEPVSLASISKRQNITQDYLEQIIPKLKKAGLVKSLRGPKGGYNLGKSQEDITVGEILRALEGDLSPIDCPVFNSRNTCDNTKSCAVKFVWKRINESIQDTVDSITLKEIVDNENDI